MTKINIAIDGHSSCGKSTIARSLAQKLDYLYVDSGAMYRSVTYYALQHKLFDNKVVIETALLQKLKKIHIDFKIVNGKQHAFLNEEDIEKEIRGIEVSNYVSQIAKIAGVRKFLVREQQSLGVRKGVVMDGRDIGTVVFPSAEVKFFVTARSDIRAQRRYDEMIANGITDVSLEDIKNNIEERDFLDSHRVVSPLIQANDAVLIDTSEMSQEEQLAIVVEKVESVLKAE